MSLLPAPRDQGKEGTQQGLHLPAQSPHLLVQPAPHNHWNTEVPPNGLVSLAKAVDFTAGLHDLENSRRDLGRHKNALV